MTPPKHPRPTSDRSFAVRFETFDDARVYAAAHVTGWPAWRVVGADADYYIELRPGGPWLAFF